jgi:hypothetical protein
MTPRWPEWTKIPQETCGCSYFFIVKSPETSFFDKNL